MKLLSERIDSKLFCALVGRFLPKVPEEIPTRTNILTQDRSLPLVSTVTVGGRNG